jgi:hypothetical protein
MGHKLNTPEIVPGKTDKLKLLDKADLVEKTVWCRQIEIELCFHLCPVSDCHVAKNILKKCK